MQNMQNMDLSLFCILKTGLHIFWHIFCIFCILFGIFSVIFCIFLAYFLSYSAYFLHIFCIFCILFCILLYIFCIYMSNTQNIDLSLFCILFYIFIAYSAYYCTYFIAYSAYFIVYSAYCLYILHIVCHILWKILNILHILWHIWHIILHILHIFCILFCILWFESDEITLLHSFIGFAHWHETGIHLIRAWAASGQLNRHAQRSWAHRLDARSSRRCHPCLARGSLSMPSSQRWDRWERDPACAHPWYLRAWCSNRPPSGPAILREENFPAWR